METRQLRDLKLNWTMLEIQHHRLESFPEYHIQQRLELSQDISVKNLKTNRITIESVIKGINMKV